MWTVHGVIVLILVIYCLMALTEVGFYYKEKPVLQNNRPLKGILKVISIFIIFFYVVFLCLVLPIFSLLLLVPVVNLILIPLSLLLVVLLIPLATAIFLAGDNGYTEANKKTVINLIYAFLALLVIVHIPIAVSQKNLYSQLYKDIETTTAKTKKNSKKPSKSKTSK